MNSTLTTFLAALLATTAFTAIKPQHNASSMAPAQASDKKAEEQFKNIQVLKGIPADQLIPTMQFISASLGVECEFCHVERAFDKDDKKPKQAARKMIQMMFAINKDNFNGSREVTCYSCHRGNPKPVAIPLVAGEELSVRVTEPKTAETEAQSNAGPSADQIIDKYVKAVGGSVGIEKINSRVMKGTISFDDKSFPIEIYAKTPDKRISFAHMPQGDSITAFDGHQGWLGMTGRPVHEMRGTELDAAALDADLQLATHLRGLFTKLELHGIERISDRDAYVLIGERDAKPPIRLYFDEQSGLLIRMLRFGNTALGLMPTQIDYADYRDADGVKIPFRWTLARPNGKFTIQLTEVKQNVPVDDAKFAKPAPPPDSAQETSK
jgi:photosynthetic reaction center cytochrome c subunit